MAIRQENVPGRGDGPVTAWGGSVPGVSQDHQAGGEGESRSR